jgi:hypothetical protein
MVSNVGGRCERGEDKLSDPVDEERNFEVACDGGNWVCNLIDAALKWWGDCESLNLGHCRRREVQVSDHCSLPEISRCNAFLWFDWEGFLLEHNRMAQRYLYHNH